MFDEFELERSWSYLPIFLILILASAGISSGSSSSSSSLNTDAIVGFAAGALSFDGPPRLILMGALGLAIGMLILVIRGGGVVRGLLHQNHPTPYAYVCLQKL